MNATQDPRSKIQEAIQAFRAQNFVDAAYDFWQALGYESDRRYDKVSFSPKEFKEAFSSRHLIRDDKALTDQWDQINILFQLTDSEIQESLSQNPQAEIEGLGFGSIRQDIIKSYLFAAIELQGDGYSRTKLANLTREINRCFAMPVLLLIKTASRLNIAVIYRRRSFKDASKDVLEKVTLIKDIKYKTTPHRAHVEILYELQLAELERKFHPTNFDQLHKAWEKTLDLKELNKRFYRELSNWFFWAVRQVDFPEPNEPEPENRNTVGLIRLLTRIIFVWFMKEKDLVPETLFDKEKVQEIIKFEDPSGSSYYKAILQNLFFATLNTEMTKDKPESRRFRAEITGHLNSHYGIYNVFRYKKLFLEPDTVIKKHFSHIPFLNGSLFECLDIEASENISGKKVYVDGFSDRADNPLKVPDFLFWLDESLDCDLNSIYGTKNKHYKIRGLLDILHSYKFTIAENTPVEEEVALDPELLGRVFENLLAAYNPETRSTARHETGSFYTPREIVDFMVNESIVAHLSKALPAKDERGKEDNEIRLRLLLEYADEDSLFDSKEADLLIAAIDETRIIDPACGSGAFPMGLLLKMVYILHKLDPDNQKWKARQIENLKNSVEDLQKRIPDAKMRSEISAKLRGDIKEIEKTFEDYDLDYSRKLFLIERCIYGVDIQPIAIQISQLRFFISLLVDQTPNPQMFNLGIEPLPNLETNLIAANSLIPIDLGQQREIFSDILVNIGKYRTEIMDIHNEYFTTHTRTKKKELRKKEEKLRSDLIRDLEKQEGIQIKNAELIANWNPYQCGTYAQFFDPGIMFGFDDFDIVIANPPYIRQEDITYKKDLSDAGYEVYNSTSDLYTYFYELAYKLLSEQGVVTFISSNKWMRARYGKKLRSLLADKTQLDLLVDFGGYRVFESATVDTNIIVFQKAIPPRNHQMYFVNIDDSFTGSNLGLHIMEKKKKIKQSNLHAEGWTLASKRVLSLKEKIEAMGKPLKDWDVNIYRGVLTGCNEAFIIDDQTKESLCREDPKSADVLKPILRGRDIHKYYYTWPELWLIKIESGWTDKNRGEKSPEDFFKSMYPGIYNHLKSIGDGIRSGSIKAKGKGLYDRDDQGQYWWELRDCAYYDEFEKPKIIWPDIAKNGCFQYDKKGFFANNTVYMIRGENLEYIIGILNSNIFDYYYNLISSNLSTKATRGFKVFIEMFPIPDTQDDDLRKNIGDLELQIIELKKKPDYLQNTELQKTETLLLNKLNHLVYKVYNLSKDEISIIEGGIT